MVGERGFEPPAPASRRQCSTRLSYSPTGTGWRTIRCRSEGLLAGVLPIRKQASALVASVAQHLEPVGDAGRISRAGAPGRAAAVSAASIVRQSSKLVGSHPARRRARHRALPRPACRHRRPRASRRRSARRLHSRRGDWCRSSPTARAAPSRRNRGRRRSRRRHWRTCRRARRRGRRRCAGCGSRCS